MKKNKILLSSKRQSIDFYHRTFFSISDDEEDRYILKNQCLQALQNQINDELYASLTYLSMVRAAT